MTARCTSPDCTDDAAELMVIYDVPRELCRHHAAVAEVWLWTTAPDHDQTRHHERPCAICREGERLPCRACCRSCVTRAYIVSANGSQR